MTFKIGLMNTSWLYRYFRSANKYRNNESLLHVFNEYLHVDKFFPNTGYNGYDYMDGVLSYIEVLHNQDTRTCMKEISSLSYIS